MSGRRHGDILRAVRTPDEQASLGLRLVLGGLVALIGTTALTAAFPVHARPAVFIVGVGAAGACWGTGGILARRALLGGTTRTIRAVATGIVGLTFAGIAGIAVVTALIGAFF